MFTATGPLVALDMPAVLAPYVILNGAFFITLFYGWYYLMLDLQPAVRRCCRRAPVPAGAHLVRALVHSCWRTPLCGASTFSPTASRRRSRTTT